MQGKAGTAIATSPGVADGGNVGSLSPGNADDMAWRTVQREDNLNAKEEKKCRPVLGVVVLVVPEGGAVHGLLHLSGQSIIIPYPSILAQTDYLLRCSNYRRSTLGVLALFTLNCLLPLSTLEAGFLYL